MKQPTITSYTKPMADVVDLTAESILCASTDNGNQSYGYGNSANWF